MARVFIIFFAIFSIFIIASGIFYFKPIAVSLIRVPGREPNEPSVETIMPTPISSNLVQPNSTVTPMTGLEPEDTWRTYRNEKYGFELKYPSDWVVLEKNEESLQIIKASNFITVSILVFRPLSSPTFQDWVNERPDAIFRFHDKEALRWGTEGIPAPTKESKFYRTEHLIVPSANEDFAVAIDMVIKEESSYFESLQTFNQIMNTLTFTEVLNDYYIHPSCCHSYNYDNRFLRATHGLSAISLSKIPVGESRTVYRNN
jgi:hypothetical protein